MDEGRHRSASNRLASATAAFQDLRQTTLAQIQRDAEHNKRVFSLQMAERQQQDK
jgi:hypothetical protein